MALQKLLSSVAILALGVNAQVALYGQCGGTGYSGSTTCASGSSCVKVNDYYSQCQPGAATTLATAPAAAASSAKPATTGSSSSTGAVTGTKYFITFGDSYSQTGFDITSTKPSASNPLGNPPLPGWTTSGGLNWIGNLVSVYNTSPTLSFNFASGGATTDASLVTPFASTVLSLVDQVKQFSNNLASHPSYAPWTSANTLVGVWIGVNDVGNSWSNAASTETTLLNKIMDQYFAQLQILYNAGVRNFVLLSVPPITKTPSVLASSSATNRAQEDSVISQYNSLLASRLTTFKSTNSGVAAQIVDTSVPFNTALNNPTAYGAKDATCYASDGTSCLWWNDYHPALAIQKLVAQAVASALKGTFF